MVEKNSVDSFSPGVEIAVIKDFEGGLLLVCSATGKYDKMMMYIDDVDDLDHGSDTAANDDDDGCKDHCHLVNWSL